MATFPHDLGGTISAGRGRGESCFPDPSKETIDNKETLGIGACLLNVYHIACFRLTVLQEMK